MLTNLVLQGVGPAKRLDVEFSERLNLITGDNGMGKSFLLDVAWWALTRTWPKVTGQAIPRSDARKASITTTVVGKNKKPVHRTIPFEFQRQRWSQPASRPQMPGLVIYAQVDGGFSVWDPARNYSKDNDPDRPSAFLFDSREVWDGLKIDGRSRCNGLYLDWAAWQREQSEAFSHLKVALERLSPPNEHLRPGLLRRISAEDSQDYPTIHMPYGIDVPLPHASAAIRRILALAYLLVWAWQEHLHAVEQRREKPAHRVILLNDEVEAHLHPAWQKRILPSVLSVVSAMSAAPSRPDIQVLASTHSPLVCVSLESLFDESKDRLLDLDLDPENGVQLESVPFVRRGTGEQWLLSRHFDLKSSYSEAAEKATSTGSALIAAELRTPGTLKKAEFMKHDAELRAILPDIDSFWFSWRRIGERKGWLK